MSRNYWVTILIFSILISTAFLGVSVQQKVQAAPPNGKFAAESCTELLVNNDMESNTGWTFGNSAVRGRYVTERYRSPYRSVLLGITSGQNVNSYSSMQQLVNAPTGSYLRLRAHVYPMSRPYDGHDAQEIIIMNSTGQPLRRLWTSISNANAWQTLEFDISEFIGTEFSIYFNVFNDGKGGVSAMYIDDVTLEICTGGTTSTPAPTSTSTPSPTPSPTPQFYTATPTSTPYVVTATPTPIVVTNTPTPPPFITATPTPIIVTNTPTPPPFITATFTPQSISPTFTPTAGVPTNTPIPPNVVCNETLINGGFESSDGWQFGQTKLRGSYTGVIVHSGLRSVHLGNSDASQPNIYSYSSISQRVSLARPGYTTATLSFWYYPLSDMEPGDTQEAILLDANTGRTLKLLWRGVENYRQWIHKEIDVTRYLGRNVIVYFNVFNDGGTGRAAMYLDDVSLTICGAITPTPVGTPTPSQNSSTGAFVTITPSSTPSGTPIAAIVTPEAEETSSLPEFIEIPAPNIQPTVSFPVISSTPEPPPTFLQTALHGLWYILIFVVIALIIAIAFLMIGLLWGQMESNENNAKKAVYEVGSDSPPTQELSPVSDEALLTTESSTEADEPVEKENDEAPPAEES